MFSEINIHILNIILHCKDIGDFYKMAPLY